MRNITNRFRINSRGARPPEFVKAFLMALALALFAGPTVSAQKTLDEADSRRFVELIKGMTQGGSTYPIPERAIKCGVPALQQYHALESEFAPLLRREVSQALVRPTLPFFYDSPSGNFKIHYATSGADRVLNPTLDLVGALGAPGADGVPDHVNAVADIFDSVWTVILGSTLSGNLGYPLPPRDDVFGTDPDPQYNIYLVNLGGLLFGATFSDAVAPMHFNSDPFAPYTSYIQMDNDFIESSYSAVNDYVARPLDAVRVTAAHEFFHAIHFGIDAFEFEGAPPGRLYWYEMSAVSMEEYIYDGINDYYSYLNSILGPTPFREPHRSLQTFPVTIFDPDADYPYAYGVFIMFLDNEFGPDLQRGIWRGCGRQGPDFLGAIDSALIAHTAGAYDFNRAFHEFGIRMAFTGSLAKFAPPGRKLDEAEFFPEVTDTTKITVDPLVTRPYPTVHSSYPLIVTTNAQQPAPEANSNTFVFLKNVFTVTGGCFKLFAGASSATPLRFTSRLALIGIPAATGQPAFISSSADTLVFIDTSILVNPLEFDSLRQVYIDSFACHDSVEIQFDQLSPAPDSFRIIVTNQAPSVELDDPTAYQEAIFIFTQTTTNDADYGTSTNPFAYKFFYGMTSASTFTPATVTQPYGVFASFPNPVTPADNSVTIGFDRSLTQVPTNALELNVTILTEAGENVRDNLSVEGGGLRLELAWDLRNQSGREVASGVYIVLQRLSLIGGEVLQSE
ncbi:MAG: MXAN_6640 family putative metalloprotease, partial [Candidatus Zixiibacteriota bacterium]